MDSGREKKVLSYILTALALLLTLQAFLIRYTASFLLPLVSAALLIGVILAYGYSFHLFLLKRKSVSLVSAAATGLIISTFYYYAVFSLEIPGEIAVVIFNSLSLVLAVLLFFKRVQPLVDSLLTTLYRPAKEYIIFILPLIYASLPSTFYDSLVYHLGIPNMYLQQGGFFATPQFLYANTSIYYELALTPAVVAGNAVPRLFHFLLGIIFIMALTDFAVRRFQLKHRSLLIVLLVSMPMSVFLLSTVKNDLMGAFFILAALEAYYNVNENGYNENRYENRYNIYMAALFFGFAVGVKYFNALPLALFLLLALVNEKDKKQALRNIFIFGGVTALLLVPLFIKNYIFTGNPVFPFLNEIFSSPAFDTSRFALMKADVGQTVRSLLDFAKLPYTLSFREIGSGGLVGAQFLIFLPFLVIKKQKKPDLLAFSLVFLAAGAFFTGSIRFMYIAFCLLAIYTVRVYESLDWKILKYLFFIIIGINLFTAFGYHERIYRAHTLYSGKISIEQYKAMGFPTYEAVDFVNKKTKKDAGVLLVGEPRGFYLERRYRTASAVDSWILKKYLDENKTQKDFCEALKREGFHYIIFNRNESMRLQEHYNRFSPEQWKRWSGIASGLKRIFDKEGVYVYEL